MRAYTAKPTYKFAGILACLALILVAQPAESRSEFNRSINLAGRQLLLVEQMTNGTMLAALGIESEQNIGNVRAARDLFSQTLRGLRDGDEELGLIPASQPEVIAEITLIEAFWPRYDQTLQSILVSLMASSEVGAPRIRELTDIHVLIIGAVDRTVAAFEQYSHGGGTHSILTSTLHGSGQLRSNSQLVLGELLAIAFRNNDAQNRRLLGENTRAFDRTLAGLIEGDAELRLLPAPNEAIRAELGVVEQLWSQVRPTLLRIASGEPVDERSIATVYTVTTRMIEPLNAATLLYENL